AEDDHADERPHHRGEKKDQHQRRVGGAVFHARVQALFQAGYRRGERRVPLDRHEVVAVQDALPEPEPPETSAEANVIVRTKRERSHRADALVCGSADQIERADTDASRALWVVREVCAPERDECVREEGNERTARPIAEASSRAGTTTDSSGSVRSSDSVGSGGIAPRWRTSDAKGTTTARNTSTSTIVRKSVRVTR